MCYWKHNKLTECISSFVLYSEDNCMCLHTNCNDYILILWQSTVINRHLIHSKKLLLGSFLEFKNTCKTNHRLCIEYPRTPQSRFRTFKLLGDLNYIFLYWNFHRHFTLKTSFSHKNGRKGRLFFTLKISYQTTK